MAAFGRFVFAISMCMLVLPFFAAAQDGPGDTCRAAYNACLSSGGARAYCIERSWNPCMLRKCSSPVAAGQCNKDTECQNHCVEVVSGSIGQTAAVSCCARPSPPDQPVNQACRQMIQQPSGLRCLSDTACPTGMTPGPGGGCVQGSAMQTPNSGSQTSVPDQNTPTPGSYGDMDAAVPDFNPPVDSDLQPGPNGGDSPALERYLNEQADQFEQTLRNENRLPIVTEGSLGAWSQFDEMVRTGQIDTAGLADYIRDSGARSFSLDTFFSPVQSAVPGDTFYSNAAQQFTSPTPGTFSSSPSPFTFATGPINQGLVQAVTPSAPPSSLGTQAYNALVRPLVTAGQSVYNNVIRPVTDSLGLTQPESTLRDLAGTGEPFGAGSPVTETEYTQALNDADAAAGAPNADAELARLADMQENARISGVTLVTTEQLSPELQALVNSPEFNANLIGGPGQLQFMGLTSEAGGPFSLDYIPGGTEDFPNSYVVRANLLGDVNSPFDFSTGLDAGSDVRLTRAFTGLGDIGGLDDGGYQFSPDQGRMGIGLGGVGDVSPYNARIVEGDLGAGPFSQTEFTVGDRTFRVDGEYTITPDTQFTYQRMEDGVMRTYTGNAEYFADLFADQDPRGFRQLQVADTGFTGGDTTFTSAPEPSAFGNTVIDSDLERASPGGGLAAPTLTPDQIGDGTIAGGNFGETMVDEFPESATEKPPEVAYQEMVRGAENRLAAAEQRTLDAQRALQEAEDNNYPLRYAYNWATCTTGIGTCGGVPGAEAALADAQAAEAAAAADLERLRNIEVDRAYSELARLNAEIDSNLDQATRGLAALGQPGGPVLTPEQIGDGSIAGGNFGDIPRSPAPEEIPPWFDSATELGDRLLTSPDVRPVQLIPIGADGQAIVTPTLTPDQIGDGTIAGGDLGAYQDVRTDTGALPPNCQPGTPGCSNLAPPTGSRDITVAPPPGGPRTGPVTTGSGNTGNFFSGLGSGLGTGLGMGTPLGAMNGIGAILQGLAGLTGSGQQQPQPYVPQPPIVVQPPPVTQPGTTTPDILRPSVAVIISLNAIEVGDAARLTWTALRANECAVRYSDGTVLAEGGAQGGATTTALFETTQFSITCIGDQGSRTVMATVYVGEEPPASAPAPLAQPAPLSPTAGTGGATSGTPATSSSGSTQQDPNYCDPGLPIDAFITCLNSLPGATPQPYLQ